jgi:hypothetical protein
MATFPPLIEKDGEIEGLTAPDNLDLTNPSLHGKTGIRKGYVPSNVTVSTFDLSAGEGDIVDNYTDPNSPVPTELVSGPYIGVTPSNVATQTFTFFYIDTAGLIQETNVFPAPEDYRDRLYVAIAYHPGSVVVDAVPFGQSIHEDDLTAYDFMYLVGPQWLGNDYSRSTASATKIKVTAGTEFYPNLNRIDSTIGRKRRNFANQSAEDPVATFFYIQDNGSGGILAVNQAATDIDLVNRDDGAGGLTPISNNRNGLQLIYRDSKGRTAVQYGVADFNPNNTSAEEAFQNETVLLQFPFGLRYVLEIPQGISDLSNAIFHEVVGNSFGGGGGTGSGVPAIPSLSFAYDPDFTLTSSPQSPVWDIAFHPSVDATYFTYPVVGTISTHEVEINTKGMYEVHFDASVLLTSGFYMNPACGIYVNGSVLNGTNTSTSGDDCVNIVHYGCTQDIELQVGDKVTIGIFRFTGNCKTIGPRLRFSIKFLRAT